MAEHILEVKHLKKYFSVNKREVLKAVDDVSFYIEKGETLGLVGESGCGKTTCGKTCIGMYGKSGGDVSYKGRSIHGMKRKEYQNFTSEVQMIFQDPYTSLDPHMRIYDIVAEGIRIHRLASGETDEKRKVSELLEDSGISPEYAHRYIHEFSGGQRQRIGIARALAVDPELIVCDEPVSALDVSVQAQIINLLIRLQRQRDLSLLFIAHDLAVVRHISDRIGVMYLGKIVELADSVQVCKKPLHPYTQALLSAVPVADPKVERDKKRILLSGDIPSPLNPPQGCRFCGRCKNVMPICKTEEPEWKEVSEGHYVACHLYD